MADILIKSAFPGGSWSTLKTVTCESLKLLPLFQSNIYFAFYVREVLPATSPKVYSLYEIHSIDAGVSWTAEVLLVSGVDNCVVDAMCHSMNLEIFVSYTKTSGSTTTLWVQHSIDGGQNWTSENVGTI